MNEEAIYLVRCRAFAALELMLDITHSTRTLTPVDGESMIIFACITEATMRQLMLSPDTPAEVKRMQAPPEQFRGSITMLSVADKLRRGIADYPFGTVGSITASIGAAELAAGDDLASWLARADVALYQAKRSGRNSVRPG